MEPTLPGAVQPGTAPAQPVPPPWRVVPPPGSRLEQLADELDAARAAVDAAKKHEKSVADSIKAEIIPLAPRGTTSIVLAGTAYRPEWYCHWVESWRLDSKRLKAEKLVTWVQYAVKGGSWKLEKAKR
jgi:hypothetical protein